MRFGEREEGLFWAFKRKRKESFFLIKRPWDSCVKRKRKKIKERKRGKEKRKRKNFYY